MAFTGGPLGSLGKASSSVAFVPYPQIPYSAVAPPTPNRLWLKQADLQTANITDGSVVTWTDAVASMPFGAPSATLTQATSATSNGKKVVSFSGTTALQCPNASLSSALKTTLTGGTYSITVLFKSSDETNAGTLIARNTNGGSGRIWLVGSDTLGGVSAGYRICKWNGSDSLISRSFVGSRQDWAVVTYTYNGSVEKLYVNGRLEHERVGKSPGSDTTDPISLGCTSSLSGFTFKGQIGEVAIDSTEWTSGQVAAFHMQLMTQIGAVASRWNPSMNLKIGVIGDSINDPAFVGTGGVVNNIHTYLQTELAALTGLTVTVYGLGVAGSQSTDWEAGIPNFDANYQTAMRSCCKNGVHLVCDAIGVNDAVVGSRSGAAFAQTTNAYRNEWNWNGFPFLSLGPTWPSSDSSKLTLDYHAANQAQDNGINRFYGDADVWELLQSNPTSGQVTIEGTHMTDNGQKLLAALYARSIMKTLVRLGWIPGPIS